MRFLADNMLGKLAKWLRFMGYDVLYPNDMEDKELVQLSRSDDRLLLTRDKELAKIKNLNVIYITSELLDEQLKQLINELNLKVTENAFIRCPECNKMLEKVNKDEIINNVPEGVYKTQDNFWFCNQCNQYFWKGSHYTKIKQKLSELLEK